MDNYKKFEIEESDNNYVAFYNEEDLLKDITIKNSYGHNENSLTMEYYKEFNTIGEYELGYCYNSLTPFTRAEKHIEGHCNSMKILNKDCSILQKDNYGNRRIEIKCPKIAWGFMAFLITHSFIDIKGRLRVPIEREEKNIIFLEEQYFKSQKTIYYRINKDDYEYYSANNLNDKIQELDTLFIKQHIKQECILLDRTKEGDDISIIAAFLNYSKEYFKFLENKLNNKIGNRKVVTDSINIEYQKQIIKPTKNKEYQESLLKLFKGNVYLISHLEGLSDDEIASLIKKWAKEKDKSGKPLIENPENRLKNKYAEELKKAGIIKLSVRTFRDKL